MEKAKAEEYVTQYIKRIYGYIAKRVPNEQDCEDLTQQACLKIYESFITKEIAEPEFYLWVIVKHFLANYYRTQSRGYALSVDDCENDLPDGNSNILDRIIEDENITRIRDEIAFLSKLQRQIVIKYYFHEEKQSDIANELGIPEGTVKWHLNVARKELEKAMNREKELTHLRFDPIEFEGVGMYGSLGYVSRVEDIFRSILSQNIVYAIYDEAKTLNEIAQLLAVSPVYIESELLYLKDMQLVIQEGKKFRANILIHEPTLELVKLQVEIYKMMAKKLAKSIYEAVEISGIINSEEMITNGSNDNFIMWSLIPWLLCNSGTYKNKISFDEVADYRADGGKNILLGHVYNSKASAYMSQEGIGGVVVGPCWNTVFVSENPETLWVIDGSWSEKRIVDFYDKLSLRQIRLIDRIRDGEKLTDDDYEFLICSGIVIKEGDLLRIAIPVVESGTLTNELINKVKLIKENAIEHCKNKISEYEKMIMNGVPSQLNNQLRYLLQNKFHSDEVIVGYVMEELMDMELIHPVNDKERLCVSQLLITGKNHKVSSEAEKEKAKGEFDFSIR